MYAIYQGNVPYTYWCDVHNAFSMIDNILIPNFVDKEVNATSIDIVDNAINFSDYLSVNCILRG